MISNDKNKSYCNNSKWCFPSLNLKNGFDRCGFTAVVFLCSLIFCTATVSAGDNAAKKAFQDGKEYFQNEDYAKAVDAFRVAYEAKPSWKLLFNIAQAEAAVKRYGLALEAFESYLTEGGDDITIERNEAVLKDISRFRMLVGVLEIEAPYGTELYIDGHHRGNAPFDSLIRVAVGKRHVNMKFEGEETYNKKLSIAGGMTTKIKAKAKSEIDNTPVAAPVELLEQPKDEKVEIKQDATPPPLPEEPVIEEESSQPSNETTAIPSPVNEDKKDKGGKGLLVGGVISGLAALGGIGLGVGFMIKGGEDADAREPFLDALNNDISSRDQFNVALLTQDEYTSYYNTKVSYDDDIKIDNTIMIAGFIAGGVFAITSAVLISLHVKKRKKNESLTLLPTPGGMMATF